jgi:hypothetical protein
MENFREKWLNLKNKVEARYQMRILLRPTNFIWNIFRQGVYLQKRK